MKKSRKNRQLDILQIEERKCFYRLFSSNVYNIYPIEKAQLRCSFKVVVNHFVKIPFGPGPVLGLKGLRREITQPGRNIGTWGEKSYLVQGKLFYFF